MKNFKKIGALLFLSAYLIIGLSFTSPTLAADEVKFTPQISVPGSSFQQGTGVAVGTTTNNSVKSDLLARYIAAFYNWGLSIVGVLAVLMLMAGGITWLTSGGDSGKIGNAKKMIEGSLLGTFLLLGAYFFLNTINPDLTKLPVIGMDNIKRIESGCCDENGIGSLTTADKCKGTFSKTKTLSSNGQCDEAVCCIFKTDICFSSTANTCKVSGNTADFKQKAQACSTLDVCKNNIITCAGKKNGDSAYGINDLVHCYNNIIVAGAGREGEDCGKKGDNGAGVCIKNSESCSDTNQIGGRTCVSGLKCCIAGATSSW